jgi:PncC family amidohydrolase
MNGTALRAQLVLSEAGLASLFAAGITPGWLKAWLQSAGAQSVDVCMLEQEAWKRAADWYVFFASEAELLRVALHFGRRIQAADDGSLGLLGITPFTLENPTRHAWYFRNSPSPSRVLLLPLGDIAFDRQLWLNLLGDAQPLSPLYVSLLETGDAPACTCPLEAGLCASSVLPDNMNMLLNDGGYLPEESLMQVLRSRGLKVRFVESCTAGGMAERLSRLPGSSEVLDCAWVTYSNDAKHRLLGVPAKLFETHGAVSREVVEAMVRGGSDTTHACVAVSGIAGPGGGSEEKPVGTVWLAVALPDGTVHSACHHFPGSRAEVRNRTVVHALHLLCSCLQEMNLEQLSLN